MVIDKIPNIIKVVITTIIKMVYFANFFLKKVDLNIYLMTYIISNIKNLYT